MTHVLSRATRFLDVKARNKVMFLRPGTNRIRMFKFSEMGSLCKAVLNIGKNGRARVWRPRFDTGSETLLYLEHGFSPLCAAESTAVKRWYFSYLLELNKSGMLKVFFAVVGVGWRWGWEWGQGYTSPLFGFRHSASLLFSGHIWVLPSFSVHIISHWKSRCSYLRSQQYFPMPEE